MGSDGPPKTGPRFRDELLERWARLIGDVKAELRGSLLEQPDVALADVVLELFLNKLVRRQKIHGRLGALEDFDRRLGRCRAISGCRSESGTGVELCRGSESGRWPGSIGSRTRFATGWLD